MAHETVTWLNADFTERVIQLAEVDSTIKVIDISAKPATNKGDNYTSDMVRVVAEFTRKRGKAKVTEKKSLLFKFEPILEGPRQDLVNKIFSTEIFMMTKTLRKMSELLGSRVSAQAYYVKLERPLCLIMEDLAPLNFRMANRHTGLDKEHATLAIQGLARFHAASVALCEKDPKQKSLYWRGMINEENTDLITFFKAGAIGLADEVGTWPNGKKYADKIRKFADKIFDEELRAMKRKDDEFNVINHGDSWTNNMMFRYDKNDKPVEHIYVDFQLCLYCSPAVDLHYLFNTSVFEEIDENLSTEALLEEYLRALTATMKRLNCKTQPPTLKEIKRSMSERLVHALVSSMNILPFALTDKKDAKTIDDVLQDQFKNPGLKSPTFQKIMSIRLKKFDEAGLLD
ncbi:hypothetical protein WN51_04314 [Melipona quadrifasciata]|uniref:CHK kinase-like domain-containing protein n=1 Tax=Melipona quadrifasciata TaxID=166423 RepID=A0A0N0U3H8_9HYME|nr:hypothetical protein WN51_04314 [Melipona quadrifasciata]